MSRATWGSRLGFMFAVAGSAVGLANIWRFPYVVGANGGSAFIILYLLCLCFIGFPVFMAEILIGRTTRTSPSGAFLALGKRPVWKWAGRMTILTGFIVSAFYSAVASWMLGYFFEALFGRITSFTDPSHAGAHYTALVEHPLWSLGFHFLFILLATTILFFGVRNGIEKGNKIMMPLLFGLLILLIAKGVTLPNADQALAFLFKPDWSALSATAVITALGQSFFTLSIGQGTMVTYGSYMESKDNLLKSCVPVVIMDTLVSLFASIVVFTIVFSAGLAPEAGPGLIFHTLPLVFSQMSGGYFVAVLFFLLVVLAALTSEISAMEPTIAFLMDERGWKRHSAVIACGLGAFFLGIPCALSASLLSSYTVLGYSIIDGMAFVASNILIPVGGFFAVILVGWIWGVPNAVVQLKLGADGLFDRFPLLKNYFWFCFKFSAPVLIIIVFLHAIGAF